MNTGIDVLDKTVQATNQWLNELTERLDTDRARAYRVLCSVFAAVRDRIGPDNAAHLAAQLPLMLRGVFYKGYRPSETPARQRTRAGFLKSLDGGALRGLEVDAEDAVRIVLRVLAEHINRDELDKVARLFPEELRDLWPDGAFIAARRKPPRRAPRLPQTARGIGVPRPRPPGAERPRTGRS